MTAARTPHGLKLKWFVFGFIELMFYVFPDDKYFVAAEKPSFQFLQLKVHVYHQTPPDLRSAEQIDQGDQESNASFFWAFVSHQCRSLK